MPVLELGARVVAKKKLPPAAPAKGDADLTPEEWRAKYKTQISVYRDLAECLVDIAKKETRLRKKAGDLTGRKSVSVAKLVDEAMRGWAFERLFRLDHPNHQGPIPNPPPMPVEPEGAE